MRLCAFGVAALLGSVSLLSAQVSFNSSSHPSGETSTNFVVSGDFNRDGVLDLVSRNTSTIDFYRGVGGGGFASPVRQSVPQRAGRMVAADFDRSGTLDLAFADTSRTNAGQITVFLSNGNGTFRQGINIKTTGTPISITLADFNGDHIPDIAALDCGVDAYLNWADCSVDIYLGRGNGTFTLASHNGLGMHQLPDASTTTQRIVAADFNADGTSDIIVAVTDQVAFLRGNGNGTFQTATFTAVPTGTGYPDYPQGLAIGHFIAHRQVDVAVLSAGYTGGNTTTSLLSTLSYINGSMQLVKQTTLSSYSPDDYQDFAAGDLNGDGLDDVYLVGVNRDGGPISQYVLGHSDGSFTAPYNGPTYGNDLTAVLIRDLDGDSRHDVVFATRTSYTSNGNALTKNGELGVLLNQSAARNCSLPRENAQNIHICAPYSGQVVGSSFAFSASGSAWDGTVKRIELWVDGSKRAESLNDQLRANVSLSRGRHTATYVNVDTFDQKVKRSVGFTAKY